MSWIDAAAWVITAFNTFVLVYFLLLNTSYLLLFLVSFGSVSQFVRRTFFGDYRQILDSEMTWPISVLVAARNEEKTIVDTVRSLLRVNYPELEIVVINDGSADRTLDRLIEAFGLTRIDRPYRESIPTGRILAIYGSFHVPNVIVVDKERGGKSDALNAGINLARYPLFCSIDADSVIEDDAFLRVVKPFLDSPNETVAAGGIVRIANGCEVKDGRVVRIELPDAYLPILQVLEYLRAFLASRVGWSTLRSLLIISGAFGVYRKAEVVEISGYRRETDTEDLDLVVRLHRHMRRKKHPYRVVFVPDPVCWTQAPTTLRDLRRQRVRWHRGLVRTLLGNRGVLFNPRYGALGMLSFPHAFLFEMLGPFVEILGYVAVVGAWLLGLLSSEFFLLFLVVAVLYGIFLSIAAVLLEEISYRRYPGWTDLCKLVVFSVVENLGYRQLLSLFKIKAFWDVVLGKRGWGRMEREAFRPHTAAAPSDIGRRAR